jgi:hypothetical protein
MTYEECLTYIKQYRIQIVKELDALEEIEENTPGYVFQERVIQDFRNLIKDMAEELRKNEDYSKPEELKIRISVNHKVNGKLKSEDKQGFINFTTCFQQEILSPNQILEEIKSGWAYSPAWFRDRRSNANFVLSELVSIDIDNGLTLEAALANNFIKENALLIHTTSSHTEENNRFRILFHLPKLIDNAEEYKVWVINLMKYLEFADASCKDVCRGFYGAKGCQTYLFNKTISEEVFLDISKKFREEEAKNAKKINKSKIDFPVDKERNFKIATSILDMLSTKIPYDERFKILCILKNEFGDDVAESLCNGIWAGKWSNEEHRQIKYKLNTINRDELSFGTLVHIAQQYGWNISDMV